jgi:Protein of unknown function (DUF2911)
MTRLARASVLCGLVAAVACRNDDPGRNVQRMDDPLASATTTSTIAKAASDTLPTDSVRKSQAAAVSQRVADTDIVVTYSRPVARGRALFGALIPYGKVWNPGADQATKLTLSRDVTIAGQPLAAGAYSVWVIPDPTEWTVILNRAADVYHTPYPGEASDALRLRVAPSVGAFEEVLTFAFPLVEGKQTTLRMAWGDTRVDLAVVVP